MWANELTGYDTLKKTRLVLCYTVMVFALQWFCNLDLTFPETRNPFSTSVFDPSFSQKCLPIKPESTGVNLLHAAVGCAQRWLISSNKNRQSYNSTVKTIIKSRSYHFTNTVGAIVQWIFLFAPDDTNQSSQKRKQNVFSLPLQYLTSRNVSPTTAAW